MDKLKLFNGLTRAFYKTGFKIKRHSPELMLFAGAGGVIVSAVMACKATRKLDTVLDEGKKRVDEVHHAIEAENCAVSNPKKAITAAYAHTGLELAKLYGPSIALGGLSLGMMLTSHGIMRKRNFALAAAYTAVDSNFKAYRKRVVDRFGQELDKELRYDVKTEEVEETIVDEKGKKKKVKKKVQTANHDVPSDFCKCYDVGCVGWTKDPEANLTFLKLQQNYANDRLQRQGYLFLNDVYEMLGFDRTTAGQFVGWLYRPNDPTRDNYVDFGIYDINKQANKDFVNGRERSIWLDFNVDGPIYNEIEGELV